MTDANANPEFRAFDPNVVDIGIGDPDAEPRPNPTTMEGMIWNGMSAVGV